MRSQAPHDLERDAGVGVRGSTRRTARRHRGDQQIDELVGSDHLRAAKKVTAALGELIGVGKTPIEIPDPTAVQSLLAKFQRAVGRYSRVMLAKVDDDDPETIERFRKAVAIPVDRYRSTRTTRDDGELVDPTEPSEPGLPIDAGDPSEPEGPRGGPVTPVVDPNPPFTPEV